MQTREAIRTRRSIRSFESEPLTADQLQEILTAAMYAPSAGDQQPWQFLVIDDHTLLQRIPTVHPYASMAPQAAAGILVCGDLQLERYPGFWVQDCAAAIQNMLLAAHDLGLGSLWTGIHPVVERVAGFKQLFSLPDEVIPMALVLLGKSTQTRPMPERYRADRVHRNQW